MDRLLQDVGVLINSTVETAGKKLAIVPGSSIIFRYISSSYQNDPARSVLELLLLLFAIRYFFSSKYSYSKKNYVQLEDSEIDELVEEWRPEPLVNPVTPSEQWELDSIPVIHGASGPKVTLADKDGKPEGRQITNLTKPDMYNFSGDKVIRQEAIKTIRKYGVGSCGPAGFYGNQDVHIQCERDIANYLGAEASILYAQGFATASSVIPCFMKRGDVIVADKEVGLGIQKGIKLSRAEIYWFEHNDMEDLERILILANRKHSRGHPPRRFIVTEGCFESVGDSPDLNKIIELKTKYKYRLLLDESYSIGVIGPTGRGLAELYGVDRNLIEITLGSLAVAFGSAGGFCAGASAVVNHQRITSLAYTFSATMPGYLAHNTSMVLKFLEDPRFHQDQLASLRKKAEMFRSIVESNPFLDIPSARNSPIIVLRIKKPHASEKLELLKDEHVLQHIVDTVRVEGLLISRMKFLEYHETFPVEHGIKIFINNGLSNDEITKAATTINNATSNVIRRLR